MKRSKKSVLRLVCLVIISLFFLHMGETYAQGIITTIAGNGTSGFSGDNGLATNASFSSMEEISVDSVGNIFIADTSNSRIRKVDVATGIITTVAGNGTFGFSGDGGLATEAMLAAPSGVFIDSSDNIYIANGNSSPLGGATTNRIRKVDVATGIITTVAENGTHGFSGDGGLATEAMLASPVGVFVSSTGDTFIAEHSNHRIRKVDAATGIITTVAGNGTSGFSGDGSLAISASLKTPRGVVVDSSGNIFIADSGNNSVRKVDAATGIITTVAGNGVGGSGGDGGLATEAKFNSIHAVFVDSAGNIFITDTSNNRIRKVDASTGIITTVAGDGTVGFSGDGGTATLAMLASPRGVFVDSTGNIFISDSSNNRIRKVIPNSVLLPGLTTIVPNSAQQGQTVNVNLTGTNFTSDMTVEVSGTGLTVSNVTVNSNISATATLTIDANATLGVRNATVTTPDGTSNSVDFTIDAGQPPLPVSDFSADITTGIVPLTVNFTDLSTGTITSWLYDFGDNNTNTEQNPTHIYTSVGSFTVSLTVTGPGGFGTSTKNGFISVNAASTPTPIPTQTTVATATPASTPTPSTTATTVATSTPIATATPGPTSTSEPESTVTPVRGTPTPTATPFIGEGSVKADFEANPTLGNIDLEVQFTDKSIGDVNSWLWDFGDGGNSTEQNPTHTYTKVDTYTVKLTVSGQNGQDSVEKKDIIDVRPPFALIAEFSATATIGLAPFTVEFTDESLNEPNAWIWDFGDDGQSSEQNPEHTYQNAGIFTVELTVSNSDDSDTIRKQNLINVEAVNLVVEFKAEPVIGFASLDVDFTDLSEPEDELVTWLWEFGDGATLTKQNPDHEYDIEGFYTVKLTVSNTSGEAEVKTKTNLIIVKSKGTPLADFKASPTVFNIPDEVDFTDLSEPEGDIASWIWDFGDGSVLTEQNPEHEYKVAGIFTVKLTVSNSEGADSEVKTNLIPPPLA